MNINDYLHLYIGQEAVYEKESCWIKTTVNHWALAAKSVNLKPILRPLSDMTEDEHMMYWTIDKRDPGPYAGQTILYLLSRGFDLFSLIENGLAIDKTKNI